MNRDTEQIWDEYLVLNAQQGDSRAMRRLLARHQAPLQRYIRRLLGGHSDAQDVLQETLLACCRQLRSLRDPALFRAWLYRIATHQCRSWQRRHYRERERRVPLEHVLPPAQLNPHQQADVQDALALLNSDERALLSLFYLHGFSVREMATALGVSHGAVKTRLYRARASFQRLWDGPLPPAGG